MAIQQIQLRGVGADIQRIRQQMLEAHLAGKSFYSRTASVAGYSPNSRNSFSLPVQEMLFPLHLAIDAAVHAALGGALIATGDQALVYKAGGFFHLHWDSGYAKDGVVVENAPNREFTAILYLSDKVDTPSNEFEFTGGQLVFPDHGVTVDPKAGLMVLAPGNSNYKHKVLPTGDSGYRMAITRWYKRAVTTTN